MNIEIINKHTHNLSRVKQNTVYCGRGSALGNPYVMQNASEKERNRVCDVYETYFNQKLQAKENNEFMKQLRLIWKLGKAHGTVYLECYCAPRRCHCETIAQFINSHD
jgi:hypothetical protein